MFETLRKPGGYRVDYLNPSSGHREGAVGLYVCGVLNDGEPYSRDAKRRLYAGLLALRSRPEMGELVAVYVDVLPHPRAERPAFRQMMADLQSGLIRKVVLAERREDVQCSPDYQRLLQYQRETGRAGVVAFEGEALLDFSRFTSCGRPASLGV